MCICVALKSVPARQTNFIICVLLFFGGHIHIDSTCACTSNHCCIKVNTEKRRIYALSNDIFSSFSNAVCALIPYPVSVYGYSVRFARCCRVCNSLDLVTVTVEPATIIYIYQHDSIDSANGVIVRFECDPCRV